MHKEHHRWHSQYLGREMDVMVYGHYGSPLLVFPTASANCWEYEDFGMIGAIAHRIEAGKVKVVCVDSVNNESWMNRDAPLPTRAARQSQYDKYIREEVVPFIYDLFRTPGVPITTTGSSFGAYHAANSLFKHPDVIQCCVALSGIYDLKRYFDDTSGYDDNFYFNNPVDYLNSLDDEYYLPLIRNSCDINIVCGTGPWESPDYARQLSDVLNSRGIPHNLDLWGSDVSHDWPWWMKQIDHYIELKMGAV